MIIENLNAKYADEAVAIAITDYKKECEASPALLKADFADIIKESINNLFENGRGKIALEDNKLVGYLGFWGPWDGCFGNAKGVFCPLTACGFTGVDRGKTASILYASIAGEMAQEEVYVYSLSLYAHDEEVARSFAMNGFGIRCSDAMMKLSDRNVTSTKEMNLTVQELKPEEKKQINPLRKGLVKHLAEAPVFFPTDLSSYDEWFQKDDIRVFAAMKEGEAIGFLSLNEEAENFITEHSKVINICGMYVAESYRNMGIAQQLLEAVCSICEKEGKTHLGVDCETLNPTALRFWDKYFTNYTYSYSRRIDERIYGYDKYIDMFHG